MIFAALLRLVLFAQSHCEGNLQRVERHMRTQLLPGLLTNGHATELVRRDEDVVLKDLLQLVAMDETVALTSVFHDLKAFSIAFSWLKDLMVPSPRRSVRARMGA